MLTPNAPCFLAVPNPENTRTLIPGKVQQVNGQNCAVVFDEKVGVPAGAEVTLYADLHGKFHQQAAKVTALLASVPNPILQFTTVGEPVSAESRGAFRVGVVSQNITLTVGKKQAILADISPDGMAIITDQPLTVGTSVDIDLKIESVFAKGSLRVQTEKKTPGGQLRYGLFAADRKGQMRKSLEALSALMQRRQLQRMARAA